MTSPTPKRVPPRTRNLRLQVSTLDIATAQHEGARALLGNVPLSQCPYIADRTPRGRYLAVMWQRGWYAKRQQILRDAETAQNGAAEQTDDPDSQTTAGTTRTGDAGLARHPESTKNRRDETSQEDA